MQALWSSGLPRHACRCVSCLNTGSNVVAGRTITAASRRRLLLGNSVTAFYTTIFAGAMFWDVNVKEKKRDEWKKQIESVREEIKQFQDEEARLVEGWALRRRERQLALPMQRRPYSTATGAPAIGPERPHGIQRSTLDTFSRKGDLPTVHDRPDLVSDALDAGLAESGPVDMFAEDGCPGEFNLMPTDFLRERAIQHLAMKRLAIKLLLRPSIAHSYGEVPEEDKSEAGLLLKLETTELLEQVKRLKKEIKYLKVAEDASDHELAPNIGIKEHKALVEERKEMYFELQKSFRKFVDGSLSLSRLLVIVSNHLLHSQEPVPPVTIELLITQFTRARQNDIVKMIMESFFPNYFPMSLPVIVASINFFNKTRDLFLFDGFLRLLQGHGLPVNLRQLWVSVRVEGVEVPVPPRPRHPIVMNALVAAALSFDQPQRANAWVQVLRQAGYREGPSVIGSFMRFYSVSPNWRDGRFTLQSALSFILSTKAHPKTEIERLILYMVILCNCCDQTQLSEAIIEAAVRCGLHWKDSVNGRDWRLATHKALRQWRDATEIFPIDVHPNLSLGRRYHRFAKRVDGMIRRAVAAPIPSEDSEESFETEQKSFPIDDKTNASQQLPRGQESSPRENSIKPTQNQTPEPRQESSPREDFIRTTQNQTPDPRQESSPRENSIKPTQNQTPEPRQESSPREDFIRTTQNQTPEPRQESPRFKIQWVPSGPNKPSSETSPSKPEKTTRTVQEFNPKPRQESPRFKIQWVPYGPNKPSSETSPSETETTTRTLQEFNRHVPSPREDPIKTTQNQVPKPRQELPHFKIRWVPCGPIKAE